jgi:hypothetical protein
MAGLFRVLILASLSLSLGAVAPGAAPALAQRGALNPARDPAAAGEGRLAPPIAALGEAAVPWPSPERRPLGPMTGGGVDGSPVPQAGDSPTADRLASVAGATSSAASFAAMDRDFGLSEAGAERLGGVATTRWVLDFDTAKLADFVLAHPRLLGGELNPSGSARRDEIEALLRSARCGRSSGWPTTATSSSRSTSRSASRSRPAWRARAVGRATCSRTCG